MEQQPFNPVRIFVSRAGMSDKLRLRDNRNNTSIDTSQVDFEVIGTNSGEIDTNIEAGDVIIWELDPFSLTNPPAPGFFPIKSIDNVVQTFAVDNARYTGSVSVLISNPVQAGNAFVAVVPNPSAGRGKFANYRIDFTLPDGTKHSHDPKIVLNS